MTSNPDSQTPAQPTQFTAPMAPSAPLPLKIAIQPASGEVIISLRTGISYTIGEKIGEGFFGIVYSCLDQWENELAAKVLKPLGKPYETVRASAEAEILKLTALRHPNITYIYDAFEYRDTFYIITERCFCPLSQLFFLKDFNGFAWLMPIARCLLQAVHYLHVNGVVHQDIHAGNVFTSFAKDEMQTDARTIQFKLADLGVAKLLSEVNAHNTRADWMVPPEVFNPTEFGPTDHRIDIYHVGLLLLQFALSKQLSFTREQILAGQPREMAAVLPPPFNFALEKTLRRHVAFRTSTAMELWRDLRAHAQASPPLLPPPPAKPNPPNP
jgi:eukaryotic-like serine/threonine-protein kinase